MIASSESAAVLKTVGDPDEFEMSCCKYLSKSCAIELS
jgi:hypothetical protein